MYYKDLFFCYNNVKKFETNVTKGAAIALKQRLRLHQGNYPEAIREGNKLISTSAPFTSAIGGFALVATPQAAFPGGHPLQMPQRLLVPF